MEVTFWDDNQPNNHNDQGETEDCAHLQNAGRSPGRLWNDHVCLSGKGVEGLRPLCQLFFWIKSVKKCTVYFFGLGEQGTLWLTNVLCATTFTNEVGVKNVLTIDKSPFARNFSPRAFLFFLLLLRGSRRFLLCFYRSLPPLVSLVMLQILVSNDRCSKMKALWTIFVVCLISGLEAEENHSGNNGKSGSSLPRSPVIQTKYGQVQGRILTFKGTRLQPVAAFKGIPYATPPVGSNRYTWHPELHKFSNRKSS